MFGIIAKTLNIASRTDRGWGAPDHWINHDHRTFAEKKRDQQDQRRWLRDTGIL